jgi:hypothetical protein
MSQPRSPFALWASVLIRLAGSIGRLIRNLSPPRRPAPIDRLLERPAKYEDDEDENNADHHNLPLRNRASRTHARCHPDAGGCCEPLHVTAFLASDNHARAQKTDAGHNALNHAAGVGAGYRMDRQHGHGRAETQNTERAHARRLAMQIAVEPEHDSNQSRSTKPKRNVEGVHNREKF